MRYCKNPSCKEEFDPTEVGGAFCSWECEAGYWDALDADEAASIVEQSGWSSQVF